MPKFFIVVQDGSEFIECVTAGEFEDGTEAARVAKDMTKNRGTKHSVRKRAEADPNAWKKREEGRFKDKTYKPLPVSWAVVSAKNPEHFLHVSPSKPELIAYFASAEDGQRDRVTETTPGRYIGQFTDLDVTGEQAKHLIAEIDGARTGVLFAWSRADFRRIYENGPSSCMHKKADEFGYGGIHPAEMYAAGDLALAHFWDEKIKKASARCVCWPEKKLYGRIYGDIARMTKALTDLGYKSVEGGGTNHGTFPAGVRFHKLENPKQKGHYVAPYLDNFNCVLVDEGDHAVTLAYGARVTDYPKDKRIMTRGSYGEWVVSRLCPRLQNMQPDDGAAKWEMVKGVDEEWSPTAIAQHTFVCAHGKDRWPVDPKYRMIIGGQTYARAAAEAIGSFTCSVMKVDYLKSDLHGEVNGKPVSKAGHVHLTRLERLKADREREKKRLADERARWQREMDLVETIVPGAEPRAMNHHVVLQGAVTPKTGVTKTYVGNATIGEVHEERDAA